MKREPGVVSSGAARSAAAGLRSGNFSGSGPITCRGASGSYGCGGTTNGSGSLFPIPRRTLVLVDAMYTSLPPPLSPPGTRLIVPRIAEVTAAAVATIAVVPEPLSLVDAIRGGAQAGARVRARTAESRPRADFRFGALCRPIRCGYRPLGAGP